MIWLAVAAALQAAEPLIPHHSQNRPEQSLRLTAAQMLRLGEVAQAKGDAATATAIYVALENDPDRNIRSEARFRHAKQLIAAKRLSAAAVLLRRILDDEPGATAVRLQLAGLLHEMGENDAALAQLRAAQSARLPASVARLIDRFSEALRAQRRSGASFEIALAPDSNINRATRSDTLGTVLGDFDVGQESKARSGTGLSLQGSAYHRVPLATSTSLLLRANSFANLYKAQRFNDIALDLSAGPEFQLGPTRVNIEAGATQRWFGQKAFQRSGRAALTVSRPIGRRTQLRLSGSGSLIDNQLNDLQDGKDFAAQLSVEHALSPTMGIVLNGGSDRQTAKDPAYATRSWSTGAILWRDFGRTTVALGADFRRLDADARLLLFPKKRADRYSRLSLAATFRQFHVRGFAPLLRFSLERNRSTVEIYDYRRTRVEVGLARAF